ncbi:MAG: hypothetical protein KFH87_09110, partial [Bacteroidetes bacterium]|nr:hypothetical protein [Bacteroidota bacterium]
QDMHVYTSGQEHNFSTDGGDTWSTEAMFSGARDIQATSGGIYVVRNDTLFYRNPDSREWHSLLVRRFLGNVANIGSAILCMTPSRLLRSTDHGKSWNTWIKERGETGFKGFIIVADSIVALAGAHPYIYLSTDYGASWQKIHLEIGKHDRITGAVLDSARHLILGTSVGLFRSTAPMLHN